MNRFQEARRAARLAERRLWGVLGPENRSESPAPSNASDNEIDLEPFFDSSDEDDFDERPIELQSPNLLQGMVFETNEEERVRVAENRRFPVPAPVQIPLREDFNHLNDFAEAIPVQIPPHRHFNDHINLENNAEPHPVQIPIRAPAPAPWMVRRLRYSPNSFIVDLDTYSRGDSRGDWEFNPRTWLNSSRYHTYIGDYKALTDQPDSDLLPVNRPDTLPRSRVMQIFDYEHAFNSRFVLKPEAIEISNWYFYWQVDFI